MARSRSGTRGRRGPRKPPRRDGSGAPSAVQVADPRERGAIELPTTITVKELAELLDGQPGGRDPRADQERHLRDDQPAHRPRHRVARRRRARLRGGRGDGARDRHGRRRRRGRRAGRGDEGSPLRGGRPGRSSSRARPIVTVMGHVDHGKTSLLDAIRTTEVAAGERGGITQHIGASEVTHGRQARRLPRHAGPRGVHRDAGPRREGHRHRGRRRRGRRRRHAPDARGDQPRARRPRCRSSSPSTRSTSPTANPDRVKTELSEASVIVEEYGGDTPLVPVSAKTRVGLDELLEMILLVADLQELKANPKRAAVGTIVEAELDKGRGAVATAIVQTGHAPRRRRHRRRRDVRQGPGARERRRASASPKAGPSTAVVVLGLADVPGGRRHPAGRRPTRRPPGRWSRARKAEAAAKGGDGQRPGDARGPLPPDPGRPGQGAADHPQGRRVGLARRDHPRPRAARPGRDPAQRPPRGRRRHHRQRHHARVGVGRDRRRLQHEDHRDRPPGRRGRGRRRPPLRHHLQAHRRHRGRPQGPARAGDRRGRRGPRRGPPDLPGRQEHGHRRLLRHRRPDRPGRRPRLARRQGHRDRPDRVAPPVPRRRPRGRRELRVRHRPGRLPRPRGGRRHRVLLDADGQPSGRRPEPSPAGTHRAGDR